MTALNSRLYYYILVHGRIPMVTNSYNYLSQALPKESLGVRQLFTSLPTLHRKRMGVGTRPQNFTINAVVLPAAYSSGFMSSRILRRLSPPEIMKQQSDIVPVPQKALFLTIVLKKTANCGCSGQWCRAGQGAQVPLIAVSYVSLLVWRMAMGPGAPPLF